ncbi:ADP-ribosyltransferase [Serratia liquefaciens]|uniref:ADP-ribosyltransferase n=1 Tax=Serratia liquefaciens TaxID=614 RepID=UPI0021578997|nr:ADP-ribosyltransferase [Serratia liquefaciens]
MSQGCVVSNKPFMSTTVDREVAKLFSHGKDRVIFEINIKEAGHPISRLTGKHDEAEMLIEDHQYFRVKNKDNNSRKIELEEVLESSLSQAEKESVIYIK